MPHEDFEQTGWEIPLKLNLDTPIGEYRVTNRIPMVVNNGNLTNFHRSKDGVVGQRVTEETATHFGIHGFMVIKKEFSNG